MLFQLLMMKGKVLTVQKQEFENESAFLNDLGQATKYQMRTNASV